MDLDWLRDFIALAEQGNFSRAAEARHVTQPAFSRRVRALEDWVGTPLFVRGAQGTMLTTAGEAFRPMALDLLQALDHARRKTLAVAESEFTSLAIAATHALSFTFFPNWISRHVDLEEVGKLNLVSDTLDACEQAMLGGEVHFLLCHGANGARGRLDREQFESVRIGEDTLVALSAPDDLGCPLWPVPGSADRPSRVLGYSPPSGLGRILASMLPSLRVDGLETVFTSHLAATLLAMTREGRGAAWLPRTLAEEDLRQGKLVKAGKESLDIAIDIRLFRSSGCRNRAADALWRSLNP